MHLLSRSSHNHLDETENRGRDGARDPFHMDSIANSDIQVSDRLLTEVVFIFNFRLIAFAISNEHTNGAIIHSSVIKCGSIALLMDSC